MRVSQSPDLAFVLCVVLLYTPFRLTSAHLSGNKFERSKKLSNTIGFMNSGFILRQEGATSQASSPDRVKIEDMQKRLKLLAEAASNNLTIFLNNATQRLYYQKKYQCTLTPVGLRRGECRRPVDATRPERPPLSSTLIKTNGLELVVNLSAELELKMNQKMSAVNRSVKAAEQAYKEYEEDSTLRGITYFNAKRINRPQMVDKHFRESNPYRNFELHYDTHFMADVNLSHSVVHVPTNVFDGSPEINNGARWTTRLNQIFLENRELDKQIYWQYFGSALGFYRVFPGSKWATSPDKVEMFDCRTKGWYIQASCSPKDLVILLDSSGSMLGLRFRIAMNTVDQILKTLGEDDFFNIMKFDSTVEYADQCFNGTLIQATAENKERLRRKIRAIDPKEMADFEKALTEAFLLFNQTARKKVGSMCNRAIMLITDGAPERYEHIFEQYNPNRTQNGMSQVRVFSFLIGEDASYNREINWMACRNKGYYVEIKTIAAVQDNLKQYVTTLAKPLALAGLDYVTWTGVYIDEAEYEYASAKSSSCKKKETPKKKKLLKPSMPDMRLMASVAAPVFDKKPDSTQQDLLGVIGTDLPIHFFRTFVAPPKLGVDAYVFAVNHNGFVLFHPDHIPSFEVPDFTAVDLSKVEIRFLPWHWYKAMRDAYFHAPNGTEPWQNDTASAMKRLIMALSRVNSSWPDYSLSLRHSMVKAETGHFWMMTLKAIDDFRRPKVIPMHYYYTQIPNTPFTLGVAIAGEAGNLNDYGFVHMDARIDIPEADMTVLEAREGLKTRLPSQWSYCPLTAEELEVKPEDYEEQLKEMYHEFEENFNSSRDDVEPPDILDSLSPNWLPEIYCEKLEIEIQNAAFYYVNDTTVYNKTAIAIYYSTFPGMEKYKYVTETNNTEEAYLFNRTKCEERIKASHIEQLRDDMQAWMYEKKFQQTLMRYIELGIEGVHDLREKGCDQETIENLLFDAEMTNDTLPKLFDQVKYYYERHGVSMIFISTRSGLTRYVTPDHSESDFINTHPETIRETFYERSVEAGPDMIVVSFDNLPRTPKRLVITHALFVQHPTGDGSLGRTAVAVAGLEMPARIFADFVFAQPCDETTSHRCSLQCGNTTFCYLLDDNGLVVYSEYDRFIGRSFAEVDPNLFIQLTNYEEVIDDGPDAKKEMPQWESGSTLWKSLYEMIIFDDYQATCNVYEERTSSGVVLRLINPFTAVFRISCWLFGHLVSLMKKAVLTTVTLITATLRQVMIEATENMPVECLALLKDRQLTDEFWNCTINQTTTGKFKIDPIGRARKLIGKRVCTKRYNVYRINPRATRMSGQLTEKCRDCSNCLIQTPSGFCYGCTGTLLNGTVTVNNLTSEHMPNCTKSWRVQMVPRTNLVILVTDNWCICERNKNIVKLLANKTLEYSDDEEQCQMLKMPRERRLPSTCASDHPHENVDVCGSAHQSSLPCNWIRLAALILTAVSIKINC